MTTAILTPRDSLIRIGEHAPDFTLKTHDRQDWNLAANLKKSEVVLCFFPFAFTGVCGTEMKCVSDELARWSAKGAQVVGVSCDSFAALSAWREKEHYQQVFLSDLHRSVCKAFGLYWADLNVAWRGTVVIAQDGRVKWAQKREIAKAMNFDEVLAAM